MNRQRVAFALLLPLAVLAGCRGTWEQRIAPAQRAFYDGDATGAVVLLQAQLTEATGSSDEGVLRLELASALQAAGRYAEAAEQLMTADQHLEQLDYVETPLDELASALFSVDPGNYRATRPERLMLNVQNMVNFLGAGNWESAAVEARRARLLMLQEDLAEDERYASRLAWGLAGVSLQLAGAESEARDAFKAADRPDLAARPGPGEASLLVVVQNGKAPVRVPGRFWLFVSGNLQRLQLPTLVPRSPGFGSAQVLVDGRPAGEPPVLLDLSAQALHRYDRELPHLLAASALQMLARSTVTSAVERKIEDHDRSAAATRNLLADLLGFLAGEVVAEALPPDTRCWSLLPSEVRALRLSVPAGTRRVAVEFQDERGPRLLEWEVTLESGGFALVNAVGATLDPWAPAPDPRSADLTNTPAGVQALALLETALILREVIKR
ncbi:MAG: hypothetical protein ACT4PU_13025 [Planctomycetota bacterium]